MIKWCIDLFKKKYQCIKIVNQDMINNIMRYNNLNNFYCLKSCNISHGSLLEEFCYFLSENRVIKNVYQTSLGFHSSKKTYFHDTNYNVYGYITIKFNNNSFKVVNDCVFSYLEFEMDIEKSSCNFKEYYDKIVEHLEQNGTLLYTAIFSRPFCDEDDETDGICFELNKNCALEIKLYQPIYFPGIVFTIVGNPKNYLQAYAKMMNEDITDWTHVSNIYDRVDEICYVQGIFVVRFEKYMQTNSNTIYDLLDFVQFAEDIVFILLVSDSSEILKYPKVCNYMTHPTIYLT
jgi:hypothetical protein